MPRPKKPQGKIALQMSSMIDVVFLLLIFFILTIEMEETLDDILKLPPAYKSAYMEEDKLQIYVLPAVILENGNIHPDSTGLIAFAPREPAPWDPSHMEDRFVSLDSVATRLKRERTRAVDLKVATENNSREAQGKPKLTAEEVQAIEKDYPLMIKADKNAFYGRILQVVSQARSIGINDFALVTSNESSEAFISAQEAK